MKRSILKACSAWVAAASLLQPMVLSTRAMANDLVPGSVLLQPNPNAAVAPYARDPAKDPSLSTKQVVDLLRKRVKYVFVLFQENESFDHYFAAFPGADGLYSDGKVLRPAAQTPGFTQTIQNTDGSFGTITPFRIGPAAGGTANSTPAPTDLDDVDHSHKRMTAKMDIVHPGAAAKMDMFAYVEERKQYATGGFAASSTAQKLKGKQMGELAMAYVDCDTIPFTWNYANRFALFDHIFQTTVGPSTPNAIAMISGQSGETQWVKHPDSTSPTTYGSTAVPIVNDPIPFWGSPSDPNAAVDGQPSNLLTTPTTTPPQPNRDSEFGGPTNIAPSLTYASLPLTLAGRSIVSVVQHDRDPQGDLGDVLLDLQEIAAWNQRPVDWRWYQEGYSTSEPNQFPGFADVHASYIGHHNGPQYFGYVSNNPVESAHLNGLGAFFQDVEARTLPSKGGVFYVRGGYDNIQNLRPAVGDVPSTAEQNLVLANWNGDDDHPGYSDQGISESLVAREINAIARSPYWKDSAIVVTYDESEGDYDHVAPRIISYDPAGLPLSRGPRIPLLLISPYGRAHVTVQEPGDHNSVIRLIDNLFNLPPLANLPEETLARLAGQAPQFATAGITQWNLSAHDGSAAAADTTGLLSGFDPARLQGTVAPLPASYAEIDDSVIAALPHYAGKGCQAINVTPIDRDGTSGVTSAPIPTDFNPRPLTYPGLLPH